MRANGALVSTGPAGRAFLIVAVVLVAAQIAGSTISARAALQEKIDAATPVSTASVEGISLHRVSDRLSQSSGSRLLRRPQN